MTPSLDSLISLILNRGTVSPQEAALALGCKPEQVMCTYHNSDDGWWKILLQAGPKGWLMTTRQVKLVMERERPKLYDDGGLNKRSNYRP